VGCWPQHLHCEHRWAAADADRTRSYAAELAGLALDVILTTNTTTTTVLQQVTRTIPIVFVAVSDPIATGG
jgi:putative ABC transport system substrate-binding protein